MATTNYMNLSLPTVSVTLGPEYATQNNTAFESIDAHDHTSGKGVKVPTLGLNINANLTFGGYKAYNLFSTQYTASGAALTGASNANSVSVYNGNLYFTNGSGNSVQITSGGALVASPGAVTTLEYDTLSGNLTIGAGDGYVFISIDTSSSRTITLPLASAVAEGRIYILKDATGTANANPFTVAISGSDTIDGASSLEYDSNYGSVWLIGDGVSSWRTF